MSRNFPRSECQQSRPHRSFEVFAVFAPWFHVYMTNSPHMWHKYNDVSRPISRSKGQKIHRLFKGFFSYSFHGSLRILMEWFHTWYNYNNPWGEMCCTPFPGQKVKGQGHTSRLRFLQCPARGSLPMTMPTLGQQIKAHDHMGRLKL